MDRSLQIQVEFHRKGEEIFQRIAKDIQGLTGEWRDQYLISTKTYIHVTDRNIRVHCLADEEYTKVSFFENFLEDRKIARDAVYNYLVNSGYTYEVCDLEAINETMFIITPSI